MLRLVAAIAQITMRGPTESRYLWSYSSVSSGSNASRTSSNALTRPRRPRRAAITCPVSRSLPEQAGRPPDQHARHDDIDQDLRDRRCRARRRGRPHEGLQEVGQEGAADNVDL